MLRLVALERLKRPELDFRGVCCGYPELPNALQYIALFFVRSVEFGCHT